MKKLFLISNLFILLFLSGCYKDDIDDLKDQVDRLDKEQQSQAEQLKQYQTLVNAMTKNLTVTSVEAVDNGTRITFSDGSSVYVPKNQNQGNFIIKGFSELNGQIVFFLDDGSVITLNKLKSTGLYVLSEGTMGKGNSELTYYDLLTGSVKTNYFKENNDQAPLGDTGNDLKLYGSRLYCAVSGPGMAAGGYIEVIDPRTGKSVSRIPAENADGSPDMPRRMALWGGRVYVTMYSGSVIRIDTTTLEISGRAALSGTYPEGICVHRGKLYICNSGQGTGNTISVVDIGSFTEESTITVSPNPVAIGAASNGYIYFTTADNTWSGGGPSNLYKLNPQDPSNITTLNVRATRLAIGYRYVYTIDTDWTDYFSFIKKTDLETDQVTDFIADGEDIYLGYNIAVNPVNGDVCFTNQMADDVYVYSSDGNKRFKFRTGTANGSSIVFVNK